MKEYNGVTFYDSQYREIVNGLDLGLDVSIYANPVFTAQQMMAIKDSLNVGVKTEWFAKPEVSCNKMFQISQAQYDHLNVKKFVTLDMTEQEMRKIISKMYKASYPKRYPKVYNYIKSKLNANELKEVKYDFLYYNQIDTYLYKLSELDSEKEFDCLLDPHFTIMQRKTLWNGLKDGDIKNIAMPDCPEFIMSLYIKYILPEEPYNDFNKLVIMDDLLYRPSKSFIQMFNLFYGVLCRGFNDFNEKKCDIDTLEMYVALADKEVDGNISSLDFLGDLKQYAKSGMSVSQLNCIKKFGADKFAKPDCPYNEEQMFVMGFFNKELPEVFTAQQMFEICSNWDYAEKFYDPLYSSEEMREIAYLLGKKENPEYMYRINPDAPKFPGAVKSKIVDSLDLLIPSSDDKVKRMNIFE